MKFSPTKLQKLLEERNIPVTELADRLGRNRKKYMSVGQVHNWVKGKHEPQVNTFFAICDVLGIEGKEICV